MESVWQQGGTLLAHATMGLGLAACAGLRAFLPLFVVGLSGRLDWIELSDSYAWLASTPALVAFGSAVIVEVLGDKFPVVDHLLDSVQTFVKPIAGALVMATVIDDWSPLYLTLLSIVAAGSAAGVVHLTKAKLRLLSTATTAGAGNPLLSASEDGLALAGVAGSIVIPPLVVIVLAVAVALAWRALRARRRLAT
jgi:hypothetical protein